jgi:hypothetical protein
MYTAVISVIQVVFLFCSIFPPQVKPQACFEVWYEDGHTDVTCGKIEDYIGKSVYSNNGQIKEWDGTDIGNWGGNVYVPNDSNSEETVPNYQGSIVCLNGSMSNFPLSATCNAGGAY